MDPATLLSALKTAALQVQGCAMVLYQQTDKTGFYAFVDQLGILNDAIYSGGQAIVTIATAQKKADQAGQVLQPTPPPFPQ